MQGLEHLLMKSYTLYQMKRDREQTLGSHKIELFKVVTPLKDNIITKYL